MYSTIIEEEGNPCKVESFIVIIMLSLFTKIFKSKKSRVAELCADIW